MIIPNECDKSVFIAIQTVYISLYNEEYKTFEYKTTALGEDILVGLGRVASLKDLSIFVFQVDSCLLIDYFFLIDYKLCYFYF